MWHKSSPSLFTPLLILLEYNLFWKDFIWLVGSWSWIMNSLWWIVIDHESCWWFSPVWWILFKVSIWWKYSQLLIDNIDHPSPVETEARAEIDKGPIHMSQIWAHQTAQQHSCSTKFVTMTQISHPPQMFLIVMYPHTYTEITSLFNPEKHCWSPLYIIATWLLCFRGNFKFIFRLVINHNFSPN